MLFSVIVVLVSYNRNAYMGHEVVGLMLAGDLEKNLIKNKSKYLNLNNSLALHCGETLSFELNDVENDVVRKYFVTKVN